MQSYLSELIHFIYFVRPPWFWGFIFLFGLSLGSFFNCLIYRIPAGKSFIFSRSYCPACEHTISAWDNIPVLSFILLAGKCRKCKVKISWRYPVVEIVTAVWFSFIVHWMFQQNYTGWQRLYGLGVVFFFSFFVPIIWIDLEHRIIPDEFTLTGIVLGLLLSFLPGGLTTLDSFIGFLAGGGPLFLIGWIGEKVLKKGEAMGGGDIKMMAALGALLGAKTILLSLFFGGILGSIGGVAVLAMSRSREDSRIAFGPYLCAGTVISLLYGGQLVEWYLNLFL